MSDIIWKENFFGNQNDFPFYTTSFREGGENKLFPHSHNEFEIIHFKSGKAIYEIDYIPYIVKEESIFIIPKNAVHTAKSINLAMCTGDVYIFSDLLLVDSLQSSFINEHTLPLINNSLIFNTITKTSNEVLFEELKIILNKIKIQNNERKLAFELKIKGLLLEFFGSILQAKYKIFDDLNNATLEKNKKMKKVFKYIHENYSKDISLNEAAKIVSLNTSYFSRYFKEYSGYTFNDYVNSYRTTCAAHMIFNTKMNITDICFETGFKDVSYFVKVFKKKMGYSPLQYRKIKK